MKQAFHEMTEYFRHFQKCLFYSVTTKYTHADLLWKEGESVVSVPLLLHFLVSICPSQATLQFCDSQEFYLASEQQNAATLCGSCVKLCLHSYWTWGPRAFCSLLLLWSTNLYLTSTYLCQIYLCASSLQLCQQNVLPWLLINESIETIVLKQTNKKKIVGFGSGP